ncbi:hypothetical protein B2J93_661 [Marssonina coronariae]|uniref:Uncharacterized protein n=1 Tax=Diplocarpon coronariae TaxID=2795749 RepID=A0A218YST5_9HELO|nr:hypothetical protein B2J93_661 [Marssonina coronariae]
MKTHTLSRSFALAWSLFSVPGAFSAYANSSTARTTTGDSPSPSDVCACTIVFSTTPEMWYHGVFNATGPTVIYTIDEDTHSKIGSSLVPSNSSIFATGTESLNANQGRYIYTTINANFDQSLVVTQTNHFHFSYSFYYPRATTLSGGLISTQCNGNSGAPTSLFPMLPYTSDVEYTSTYIGQPQFLEGAQAGLEDFDAFAARVAKLVGAPTCKLIGAGGTGDLKVAVSILTSSSTVYTKAEQTTSDAAAPGPPSQTVTTPTAAPVVVPSIAQAPSTLVHTPTTTLEPTPESSSPEGAPSLLTIPSSSLDREPSVLDIPPISSDQLSRSVTPPTAVSNPVENSPPVVSQPHGNTNGPPAPSPKLSSPQPSTIPFPVINPSPAPQTTIFFTLSSPVNQMPTAPRTTTLFIGASPAPAKIIILPLTSGFVLEGTTLTLGGAPATIASQLLSVGSSGLEILQPSSASAQEHPSAVILVPLANPSVSAQVDGGGIGGVIASIFGLPAPEPGVGAILNPVMTVGTQPFTISAAQSGGLVVDAQTLTSGGNIVVAGSTLSLAPSGNEIIIIGAQVPSPLPVITLGTKPLTISAVEDGVVVGIQTLKSGDNIVVEGETLSLAPSGEGIVVNGHAETSAGGQSSGEGSGSRSVAGSVTATSSSSLETSSGSKEPSARAWIIATGICVLWASGII